MNLGVIGLMGVLPTHTISGFFVMIVPPQRYFRRFLALFFSRSWRALQIGAMEKGRPRAPVGLVFRTLDQVLSRLQDKKP